MANIHADPRVIIHVGGEDIPALAVPVNDRSLRREFFTRPATSWYSTQAQLERLIESAPMVEIIFDD